MGEMTEEARQVDINLGTKSGTVIVTYNDEVSLTVLLNSPILQLKLKLKLKPPITNNNTSGGNNLHVQALYINAPNNPTIPPAPINTALTAFRF